MSRTPHRQITLRLPLAVYDAIGVLARQRRVSKSKVVREALEAMAAAKFAMEMRTAYEALSEDAETDAEPFFAAQREVVLREPH